MPVLAERLLIFDVGCAAGDDRRAVVKSQVGLIDLDLVEFETDGQEKFDHLLLANETAIITYPEKIFGHETLERIGVVLSDSVEPFALDLLQLRLGLGCLDRARFDSCGAL